MAGGFLHRFHSAVSDTGDATKLGPTHWHEDHALLAAVGTDPTNEAHLAPLGSIPYVGGAKGKLVPSGLDWDAELAKLTATVPTGQAFTLEVTGSDAAIDLLLAPKYDGVALGGVGIPTRHSAQALWDIWSYFPLIVEDGSAIGALGGVAVLGANSGGTTQAPTIAVHPINSLFLVGLLYDGSAYQQSAIIDFSSDGAISAGSAPGKITFHTAPTGSIDALTNERLRIDSAGQIIFKGPTAVFSRYTAGPVLDAVGYFKALFVMEQGDDDAGVHIYQAGGIGPTLSLQQSAGTVTSPTATTDATILGQIWFGGWGASQSMFGAASIQGVAEGGWSDTTTPSAIAFRTSPTNLPNQDVERLRIDSAGRVNVSQTAVGKVAEIAVMGSDTDASLNLKPKGLDDGSWASVVFISPQDNPQATLTMVSNQRNPAMVIETAGGGDLILRSSGSSPWMTGASPTIGFMASSGTLAAPTLPAADDLLGALVFYGWDGDTNYVAAAAIQAAVGGTPGEIVMPGRLTFSTTPDGSNVPVERLRIDSAGRIIAMKNLGGVPAAWLALDNGGDFTGRGMDLTHSNANGSAFTSFSRSRGTITSPTAVQSGDTIGLTDYIGYGATGWKYGAGIEVVAEGDFTDASAATRMSFSTTPAGETFYIERLRIDSAGRTTIGPQAPAYLDYGNGDTLLVTGHLAGPWAHGTMALVSDAGSAGSIFLVGSGGTLETPTATLADQGAGAIYGLGFGSGYVIAAAIEFIAEGTFTGNYSSGSAPARMVLSTTPTGANYPVERLRIDSAGKVYIGSLKNDEIDGTNILLVSSDGSDVDGSAISLMYAGPFTGPYLNFYKARTSFAAPTAVQAGDALMSQAVYGYGATGWRVGGSLKILAEENWTDTANGTYFRVSVVPAGASSEEERLRIDSTGLVQTLSRQLIGRNAGDALAFQPYFQLFIAGDVTAEPDTAGQVGIYAAGTGPCLNFYAPRGTLGSPTATQSGDVIGSVYGYGHDGTGVNPGAAVVMLADGAFTSGSAPGQIRFYTTPAGTIAPVERMRLTNDGVLDLTGLTGILTDVSTLPTSNPGAGKLWNDAGTVKVGT